MTKLDMLKARAKAMSDVRSFFEKRGVMEVDVPALTRYASIDPYIDLIETRNGHFLHSSPEYALKRLLCEGSGDIFSMGHVFRKEEIGSLHNCEFSMIEWYRINSDQTTFLTEVIDLFSLFLGKVPYEMINFDDAFNAYAQPIEPSVETTTWSDEEKMFYQWATFIEPNLGKKKITIITNFPAQHAVLAKTHLVDGEKKAKRYEFYFEGIELANGFDELADPDEHLRRFNEANELRKVLGKKPYPIDQYFLEALSKGKLPENTFGMAVGFDRLLMLQQKREHIKDVLSFTSEMI